VGRAYVAGGTSGLNFQTTVGAFDTTPGGPGIDGFISVLSGVRVVH
jgi:hypothetical protein